MPEEAYPIPIQTVARLTTRELDVLEMTSLGLTNRQVANNLGLSVHAVKFHLASIYRKLDVSNRTEAAVAFLRANGANGRAAHTPGTP